MFEASIHRNRSKKQCRNKSGSGTSFYGFENDYATNLAPSSSMLGHYRGVQEILDRSRGGQASLKPMSRPLAPILGGWAPIPGALGPTDPP